MGYLSELQMEISRMGGSMQGITPNDKIALAILNELKIRNGKGRPYLYVSDLLTMLNTITTPTQAESSPVLDITTPPQPLIINTMAIGWDSNAAANYKYFITIDGITFGNPAYIGMASFSASLNLFSDNAVEIPANAEIKIRAYNSVSGNTNNGTIQFYLLGYLQKNE